MTSKKLLLASASLILIPAAVQAQDSAQRAPPQQQTPGSATDQQATPPTTDQEAAAAAMMADDTVDDSNTIVVTGRKLTGSVIGDIPPENTLTSRDIRATGATDINDLLDAIAPQIGSAQGRGGERPVFLLNGQRISSFRELRDVPTEAISRVEILPEEVALKYGYRADQKVVNFVLRSHFRSTTASATAKAATEGGYLGGVADVTRLMIGTNGRTTINLHAEGNNMLGENERDILIQQLPAGVDEAQAQASRSLIGDKVDLRGSATVNRQLGSVAATGNVELEHSAGRSLIGLGDLLLQPLARNTTSDTEHVGFVLNGDVSTWRWSVTGNADAGRNVSMTDRDLTARDLTNVRDRSLTTTLSSDVDATAHGNLVRLPAGDVGTTLKIAASTLHLDGDRIRDGSESFNSLGRTSGDASVSVDLPVSRKNSDFAALGTLTLNANAEVEQLSDFGTLTTIGAGANFSPLDRLNFITSWSREEGAPTIQQLGDPVLDTPETRIFDFTTGQTVLATAITGGNSELGSDRRNVLKIGANWKPFDKTDLRFRGEYVRSRIANPISNFPGPTPELEGAFPGRFVRDSNGQLASVDLRPVNYDNSRRDTLRVGFDFSKPLKSAAPSPAQIAAFQARQTDSAARPVQPAGGAASSGSAPTPPDHVAAAGGRPGGASGFRGRGRFGGREGGRLQFSLSDTITLLDQVTIRQGLPNLDYLHGDALGQSGGRPRHDVEARAGYFNNGLGARLSANVRSGTEVTSATGDNLRFSPLATFDLRLFANLGQRYDLVAAHPWLRGSSIRFEVDNIFDTRPKVRDSLGAVPFNYQPDLLDPLGRTVSITLRKLFLPRGGFRGSGSPGAGGRGGGEG